MKRLVPALLALLAGCGEPTIPEQLVIEVGDRIIVVYESSASNSPVEVTQISGDWVRTIDAKTKTFDTWRNLRVAHRVLPR